jgi:8-oxo-dGTP diphosphatase
MKRVNVVAALIEVDGRFLVGLRSTGKYIDYWEFPGGKVELNEQPEEALSRELMEEFGLTVTINQFAFNIKHEYEDFILDMDCYWCHIDNLSNLVLNDHSQIDWYDPKGNKDYRWLPADIKVVEKLRELA